MQDIEVLVVRHDSIKQLPKKDINNLSDKEFVKLHSTNDGETYSLYAYQGQHNTISDFFSNSYIRFINKNSTTD